MKERPRVTILYPAKPGARFDFGYYVPNHLPLAVGTSLRHAAITYCDASRPVMPDSPYTCICTVGFESVAAMDDFRHFFASGHPETARILSDEPNYTNITPLFVAGMSDGAATPALTHDRIGYRLQLVFHASPGSRFDHDLFREFANTVLIRNLGSDLHGMDVEWDTMSAGVLPDSAPDIHCICTAWIPNRVALDALATDWAGTSGAELRGHLSHITNVSPQAVFADVLTLDMARAQTIARTG